MCPRRNHPVTRSAAFEHRLGVILCYAPTPSTPHHQPPRRQPLCDGAAKTHTKCAKDNLTILRQYPFELLGKAALNVLTLVSSKNLHSYYWRQTKTLTPLWGIFIARMLPMFTTQLKIQRYHTSRYFIILRFEDARSTFTLNMKLTKYQVR